MNLTKNNKMTNFKKSNSQHINFNKTFSINTIDFSNTPKYR